MKPPKRDKTEFESAHGQCLIVRPLYLVQQRLHLLQMFFAKLHMDGLRL
jgi:hypothetical protein